MTEPQRRLRRACDDDFVVEEFLEALATVGTIGAGELRDKAVRIFDTRQRALAKLGLVARHVKEGRSQRSELLVDPIDEELVPKLLLASRRTPARTKPETDLKKLAAELIGKAVRGALVEELSVKTRSRRYLITVGEDAVFLTIHERAIRAAGQRSAIPQADIELAADPSGPALARVVAAIDALPQVFSMEGTPLQWARRRLGLPGAPYGGSKPRLEADDITDQAARAIGLSQLEAIRSYEPGTRLGFDSEHLHKMRVATRRVRAALSLFGACFEARALDFLKRNFKWLAAVLGTVRDLDVHGLALPDWRRELDQEPAEGWQALADMIERRREATRAAMLKQLDSYRYRRLLERAEEAFSKTPRRRAGHSGLDRVTAAAAAAIRKRSRQFRKAIATAQRSHAAEDVHQLRIIGKKLRYTGEFFKGLYSGSFTAELKRIAAFQDRLGLFQDSVVAGALARELRAELLANQGAHPVRELAAASVLGLLIGADSARQTFAWKEAEAALEELKAPKLLHRLVKESKALA